MGDRLLEAISLASGQGWWLSKTSESGFKPLACWVLGLKSDSAYPTLAPEKVVVGVSVEEIDSIIGLEIDGRVYYHDSEFWKPGEELK